MVVDTVSLARRTLRYPNSNSPKKLRWPRQEPSLIWCHMIRLGILRVQRILAMSHVILLHPRFIAARSMPLYCLPAARAAGSWLQLMRKIEGSESWESCRQCCIPVVSCEQLGTVQSTRRLSSWILASDIQEMRSSFPQPDPRPGVFDFEDLRSLSTMLHPHRVLRAAGHCTDY